MSGERKKGRNVSKRSDRISPEAVESHRMAIIGRLYRGIAHDMKNPLAVILQGSEFLEYSAPLDDSQKGVLEMIKKAAVRIDNMLESTLGFARSSAGPPQVTDIRTLIDESLTLLAPQFNAGFVQVAKDFPPSIPGCKVNRNDIRHALVSVLMNAIGAIPDDGIISIEVRQVQYRSGKESVSIMITDNGRGIGEDERAFAVARDIIERQKGYFSIESKEGKGTSVLLVLPAE